MRKNKTSASGSEFSLLAVDDDKIMTLTLQAYFQSAGYKIDTENDPYGAIERVRNGSYDILLLDFLMSPICGDKVVAEIRKFNTDLYIILLTGHKSMAPPVKTIRELDIQGYYEKSDRFDQLELLVESCAKSIRQMRTIRQYRDGLRQIIDSNPMIYRLQSLQELAEAVRETMLSCAASDSGFVYFCAPDGTEAFAGDGDEDGARKDLFREYPEGYLSENGRIAVPIQDEKQRPIGILSVEAKPDMEEQTAQLDMLFARQVSAAVGNALLHMQVSEKNDELGRAYDQLNENYLEVINTLRTVVDARDFYTRGHSDRVSYYAVHIARAMGRDERYQERVRIAGLFHDVGKIGVSDVILLKEGKLTAEERAQIQNHAEYGVKILSSINFFKEIVPIVAAHHEWVDGTGYPRRLSGTDIPEEARIISVADAFDAMTSHRKYRSSLTLEQAEKQLKGGRGTQFDAAITDVFLELLQDYEGMLAELREIEKSGGLPEKETE